MANGDDRLRALEQLREELIVGGREQELAALDLVLAQARQQEMSQQGGGQQPQAGADSTTGGARRAGAATGGSAVRGKSKTYLKLKKKYYTPAEVAKRVGVSRQTIVKWIERGELEAELTPGGHHRIPASVFHREGRGETVQLIPLDDE